MTLKKQFLKQLKTATPTLNRPHYQAGHCAGIAEQFAMEFAHFLRTECYISNDYLTWFYKGKYYNEGLLLDIFKKEKGL